MNRVNNDINIMHQVNHIYYAIYIMLVLLLTASKPLISQDSSFINSIGIKMIKISAGSFQMGDLVGIGQWDEYPIRKVTISYPFFISEKEITIDQYRRFKVDQPQSQSYSPYVTGVSWDDAQAFCEWLSKLEQMPYRIPTEAEWEYVCRAGTPSSFSSGDSPPPPETANSWGVYNMHSGVLEWCYDWYGPYVHHYEQDPIGRENGYAKVIRGGLPDDKTLIFDISMDFYARSSNRSSLPPAFDAFFPQTKMIKVEEDSTNYDQFNYGLTGILYDDTAMIRPLSIWRIQSLQSEKISWQSLNDWSVIWEGSIIAPFSGEVHFTAEADDGIKLMINGQVIIDGWSRNSSRSGSVEMIQERRYPLRLIYYQNGGPSFMRLYWEWDDQKRTAIPEDAIIFTTFDQAKMKRQFMALVAAKTNEPSIGFRIVQAPLPESEALPEKKSFVHQGIKQIQPNLRSGPDLNIPYFRKRYLLPIPPENSEKKSIEASGMHPTFSRHTHDPGLEVCPNGDLLAVLFTSTYEDEPEVSLLATRLRFGSDQWDMPSPFLDFADVNDVAPLLWNDNNKLCFFFGNLHLDNTYPFQWMESEDNGASWSAIKYPQFEGSVGPHTPQPINSAFRDKEGTIYLACDGLGASSVLYVSPDNGETWYDTGGRTGGRHTSFVMLNNGDFLGMGGKHSNIDGYMPEYISSDKGKTWRTERSVFCALGSNQRPSIIRLDSGRLFMCGDFQRIDGQQPQGFQQRGAYVALSDDEGKTWHIKKLPGAQEHESEKVRQKMMGTTLGYAIARQAPNGMIHLIATMTHPCLHFEMNEAWILSKEEQVEMGHEDLLKSPDCPISNIQKYEERYPDGKVWIAYGGGFCEDGRYLLHGNENWYYKNGQKQYEAVYHHGRKISREIYWNFDGQKCWEWEFLENNTAKWIQWWPNGIKKSESYWSGIKCEGPAKIWDKAGKLISSVIFKDGKIIN